MPALNEAISNRRFKQVSFLVNTGINLNSKNSDGSTPLLQLCDVEPEEKAVGLAKLFISKGGKINKTDCHGRTPLMCAIIKGKKKLATTFLGEVIDFNLNAKDKDGNTALSHASAVGNVDSVRNIVRTLRRFGLSVDVANNIGLTPLMIAAKHGNFECVEIIMNEGKPSVFVRDHIEWKTASEWTKKPPSKRLPFKAPLKPGIPSSLPLTQNSQQKQEIQQLYHIYENQLTSTYRQGFDNSKIISGYDSTWFNLQPSRHDREASPVGALFTKSTAVIRFKKNARKVSRKELLTSSCPSGILSENLNSSRETNGEFPVATNDRPRRPIRSRSEILFTDNILVENEIDSQSKKKLPRISKARRMTMNPIMSIVEEIGVNTARNASKE